MLVLVPVKAFGRAKLRLADVLDGPARAALAREMADRVVTAAASLPVAVVCDDDDVAAWAESRGARVLWRPGHGLNGAVNDAVATVAGEGVDRVMVTHADLPLATGFDEVLSFDGDGVVLVPDRHEDGTNVAVVPAASGFTFAYGPGSFDAHRKRGRAPAPGPHRRAPAPPDLGCRRPRRPGPARRRPDGSPVGGRMTAFTTNLPTPARALAIAAHPDDVEFNCGATFAKWSAAGCVVNHLILTDGSKGSWDPNQDTDELIALRQEEQRAAARALGSTGEVGFCGWVDGELEVTLERRGVVAWWIRHLRPEVVLAHDPWKRYRLHPDHRAAGFLAGDGIVAARDPHFFPEHDVAPWRPSTLLLFEADEPDHVEDVTDWVEPKLAALECHRVPVRDHHVQGPRRGDVRAGGLPGQGAGEDGSDGRSGRIPPGRGLQAGRRPLS